MIKGLIPKFFLFLVILLAVFAAIIIFNTLSLHSRQISVAPLPALDVDTVGASNRLSAAVAIRTISFSPALAPATREFRDLHILVERSFPKVHANLKREKVGGLSLLYTWEGTDSGSKPILLMAHQDTVPIAPGTEKDWTYPPFSGEIRDGFVWGRGSWDDKGNMMAMLEAIEILIAQNYRPKQTIYLSFGHDEELGGPNGARAIAELFKARGITFDFVLDEGMLVTEGITPGIEKPVALVGVAEKGFLTLELEVEAEPGHSSMPPPNTAIGGIARALAALEANPMPAVLKDVSKEMFATLAPEMSGANRVLLANLWLTEPLLRHELAKSASSNAMMRTTTALTVAQAGDKENVLPGRAKALVNFRLMPGSTRADVLAHVKQIVGPQINIREIAGFSDPSPISQTSSRSYRALERSIREVFTDAIVAPGIMIASTDSKHMLSISNNIFRFTPVRAKVQDLTRFHGTNERVSISNYCDMIRFYHRLIVNLGSDMTGSAQP